MSAPVAPGDWVECVGPKGAASRQRPDIVGGRIYMVDDLVTGFRCGKCGTFDHAGLHLVGIARHEPGGFGGCQFRPIYRPDESLIKRLFEPLPADVEPVS